MIRMGRTINLLLTAAVVVTTLSSAAQAAQPCCCPDHEQTTPCAMSCGPFEPPDALQAAVTALTTPTVTADAHLPSTATLSVLHPAETLARFTAPHDASPPKRYLLTRVLRL